MVMTGICGIVDSWATHWYPDVAPTQFFPHSPIPSPRSATLKETVILNFRLIHWHSFVTSPGVKYARTTRPARNLTKDAWTSGVSSETYQRWNQPRPSSPPTTRCSSSSSRRAAGRSGRSSAREPSRWPCARAWSATRSSGRNARRSTLPYVSAATGSLWRSFSSWLSSCVRLLKLSCYVVELGEITRCRCCVRFCALHSSVPWRFGVWIRRWRCLLVGRHRDCRCIKRVSKKFQLWAGHDVEWKKGFNP